MNYDAAAAANYALMACEDDEWLTRVAEHVAGFCSSPDKEET